MEQDRKEKEKVVQNVSGCINNMAPNKLLAEKLLCWPEKKEASCVQNLLKWLKINENGEEIDPTARDYILSALSVLSQHSEFAELFLTEEGILSSLFSFFYL